MVQFFKDFQEVCLDKLTQTHGEGLEVTANITSPKQLDLVIMGNIYGSHGLRSRYFTHQEESLLRLTCSYQGRARSDITEIGKSVKLPFMAGGLQGGGQ